MSLYRTVVKEAGIDVKIAPQVKSWEGWPKDVTNVLAGWNRDKKLSFIYNHLTEKCSECDHFFNNQGTTICRYEDRYVCDDCIVLLARKRLEELKT